MKINKDYIEKIKDIKSDFRFAYKSCLYLNENFCEKLHEDIIRVEFESLYLYIEIALFECGLIDKK